MFDRVSLYEVRVSNKIKAIVFLCQRWSVIALETSGTGLSHRWSTDNRINRRVRDPHLVHSLPIRYIVGQVVFDVIQQLGTGDGRYRKIPSVASFNDISVNNLCNFEEVQGYLRELAVFVFVVGGNVIRYTRCYHHLHKLEREIKIPIYLLLWVEDAFSY